MPLLLAPAEGSGGLRPLLSSSIQKDTLRQSFRHLELQNQSIIKKIQDGRHGSKMAASNRYESN